VDLQADVLYGMDIAIHLVGVSDDDLGHAYPFTDPVSPAT
jgi:hypothetical protein